MSDACNTATVLSRELFSCQEVASALQRTQAFPLTTTAKLDIPDCVQSGTVLEIVESLAFGHNSEGAIFARKGAVWAVLQQHRHIWTSRLTKSCASIRPVGTFGAECLSTPCGTEFGPDGNLWVASLGGQRLTVFSPQGELVRHVPLPGALPWGVFAADDQTLWVCNYACPQLTHIDQDGTLIQRLDFQQSNSIQNLRPILGAAHSSELYLILSDKVGRNRRLARTKSEIGAPLEFLPCPVTIPSAVRVHSGRLYVSNQNPPALVSRPLHNEAWICHNTALVPEYLTQFAFAGDNVWLATRGLLTRLGPAGEVELVVDAAALSGHPNSYFCDLRIREGEDGPRLYATDNIHNMIHVFQL